MGWFENAQCVGLDPREFDLDWLAAHRYTHRPTFRRVVDKHAERVCHGCPVIRECALDAMRAPDIGVIRGGVALHGQSPAYCAKANRAKLVLVVGRETRKVSDKR